MGINRRVCERILIGGSAGSLVQLLDILEQCTGKTVPAIIVAMHTSERGNSKQLKALLQSCTSLKIESAEDNIKLASNTVYLASGDYHVLLAEEGQKMHLYDDEPYNFSKPSIDILFYSCIGHVANSTKALLLSGANTDGAESLSALLESGADCKAISPNDCEFPSMPNAAAKLTTRDIFMNLSDTADWMSGSAV